MSLILDALRKSDMERSRQKAPDVAASGANPPGRTGKRWLWPVMALLLVNLVFLAYLVLKPSAQTDAAAPALTIAAAQPAADTTAKPDIPPTKADVRSLLDETIAEAASGRRDPAAQAAIRPDPAATPSLETSAVNEVTQTRRESLPSFAELASSGALTLAPLSLELHVYSDRQSGRFAFINGQKVVEGSRLNGGGRVSEITRFGVILEHDGQRFVLDRD